MNAGEPLTASAIEQYIRARPRYMRWRQWLGGRRYCMAGFVGRAAPLVVVAHSWRDADRAQEFGFALALDWAVVPVACRAAYDETLSRTPGLVVVQLRRRNACGCLGHRHALVKEAPFAETHELFRGTGIGEMDIAWESVARWPALPLSDTALDATFLEGSRLTEFRQQQFRLRLLSVFLHEVNHLVNPQEPEDKVRERSLEFYRQALAHYVEDARASLSLTIDRSFSRLG